MDKAEAFLHRYLHTSTRGGIEAVLVVLVLVSAEPTPKSLLYGSCISAVGLLVRLWAAGYVLEAGALNGPYRFVRQPHLLGTALLFFGLCLAGRNALVAACAVTLLAVFHSRAYGRLDSHTAVRLQTAFAAYKEHVPALVPRLWPYPGLGRGRFSWQQALLRGRHRELDALLTLVGFCLLFYLLIKLPAHRSEQHLAAAVVVLCGLAARIFYYALRRRASSGA